MTVFTLATAMAIIAGVASQYGWLHAVAAAGVTAFFALLVRVLTGARRISRANGHDIVNGTSHRAADWIPVLVPAAVGTEAARDLALEAQSVLDDMAAEGAHVRDVRKEAWRAARGILPQLRARGRTRAAAPRMTGGEAHNEVANPAPADRLDALWRHYGAEGFDLQVDWNLTRRPGWVEVSLQVWKRGRCDEVAVIRMPMREYSRFVAMRRGQELDSALPQE